MRAMIRFGKQPRLRFISHLDLQRFFQRALNRTGLPIAWTQGFNPHPILSFGSALALGWTSEYEILDVKLSAPMGRKRTEDAMRAALPILDAAVGKLVRLTGGFDVACRDKRAEDALRRFLRTYAGRF